ncbi:MAG TPA: ATP-binding protein [Planctomycetota bacterium]|nr:ATP-binding protein [Planctomycetota bacterium]
MKDVPSRPSGFFLAARHFSEAALLLDPLGKILDANDAAAELLGRSRETLVRRTLADLTAGSRSALEENLKRWARAEASRDGVLELRGPDGSAAPLACRAVLLGPPARLGGTFILLRLRRTDDAAGPPGRKLRRRKKADESSRRSEERLRLALEAAELGIWDWNLATGEFVCSDRVLELWGLDPGGRLTVENFLASIHPEDRSRVERSLFRNPCEQSPSRSYKDEFRVVDSRTGRERWVAGRGRVFCDDANLPVRLVGAVLEVTERRRAQEEIRRLKEDLERRVERRTAELEEAVRELETFVYSVSHDLRAPLRSMASFGEILLEGFGPALGPEGREYAWRIVESARRMDKLTCDLLAYSRLSRSEIALEAVDLEALADEILGEMAPDLERAGARVAVERPLPRVTGHRLTLRQAILNLVGNAVKFVRPGVAPQVRIFAARSGDRVRLVVEDNGIGIAREHQGRLFRVFERLHANGRYAGSGIGLAMVKRALERMGGRVGVESEEGKGSRFWVELPEA